MGRLLVHVEGRTERDFVNEVLAHHLLLRGYHNVSARTLGNARHGSRRGGIRSWIATKSDIVSHLREDPACIATTMVDYYGMPQKGEGAWPGRAAAGFLTTNERAEHVERSMLRDISVEMGHRFDPSRFVPFVVMHEFEGLLFSDCASFSRGIGQPNLELLLLAIRQQYPTPEDINESPDRAPSKRLTSIVPGYQKPLHGVLGVLEIGLHRIREQYPHFDAWLTRLESLVG